MLIAAGTLYLSRRARERPDSLLGRVCALPRDAVILFATRAVRMFAYGALSVVLFVHLAFVGLSAAETGTLLTAIVLGDLGVSLLLTTHADGAFGRRRTLVAGSVLMAAAGVTFATAGGSAPLLFVAGTLGVISASGGEIGPCAPVEQAAILDAAEGLLQPATLLAAYNCVGALAQAAGCVVCGALVAGLQDGWGLTAPAAHAAVFYVYAALGAAMAGAYVTLSPAVEPAASRARGAELCEGRGSAGSGDGSSAVDAVGGGAVGGVAGSVAGSLAGSAGAKSPLPLEAAEEGAVAATALGGTVAGAASPTAVGAALPLSSSAAAAVAAAASAAAAAPAPPPPTWHLLSFGLHSPSSRAVVAKLCALFALDAHAGGLVMQSWLALFMYTRWDLSAPVVGSLLMAANIVGGVSSLAAAPLVARFGAINTAVATHLPSNLLLMAVPLAPSAHAAAALLIARFSISQMDVPARQAFVASVVDPDERSAAGGLANVARSLGLAASPLVLAAFAPAAAAAGVDGIARTSLATLSAPFFVSGALSCIYDTLLFIAFHWGLLARDDSPEAAQRNVGSGGSGRTAAGSPLPKRGAVGAGVGGAAGAAASPTVVPRSGGTPAALVLRGPSLVPSTSNWTQATTAVDAEHEGEELEAPAAGGEKVRLLSP